MTKMTPQTNNRSSFAYVGTLMVLSIFMVMVYRDQMLSPTLPLEGQHITSPQFSPQNAAYAKPSQCLSLEDSFLELIESSNQVFFTQIASENPSVLDLVKFAPKCQHYPEDVRFFKSEQFRKFKITDSYNSPSILSDVVKSSKDLIDLVTWVSDNSLIIHSHRHEADRLLFAIRQVFEGLCVGDSNLINDAKALKIDVTLDDDGQCFIDEGDVLNFSIYNPIGEIAYSSNKIWNCDSFDKIEDYQSNVIVVNHKQVEKALEVLAKKHCPELLEELPLTHSNTAEEKMKMFVRLGNATERAIVGPVKLDDWLERKKRYLQWRGNVKDIDLKSKESIGRCRGKLRKMEATLFGCEDEIMALTRVPGY